MKDPQATDSYYVKLSGKASLPEPLEIGSNYHISIEGAITGKDEDDNDDGTHSHSFKFKPVIVEILTPKGKTIKARDVRKRSQQLHSAIWKEWTVAGDNSDQEGYYDKRMVGIIQGVINGTI